MDIELIPLHEDDIELVRTWRNSKDVAQYMFNEDYITPEQQQQWFAKISQEKNSRYWIASYDGTKVGLANITGINPTFQSAYWGFYVGDTSMRGAGIGNKMLYNIIQYAFQELKLNKLRCEVFVHNDKVVNMYEKFGFRREAYYREHCIKGDQKLDVLGLALLQKEWELLREGLKQKIYRH